MNFEPVYRQIDYKLRIKNYRC